MDNILYYTQCQTVFSWNYRMNELCEKNKKRDNYLGYQLFFDNTLFNGHSKVPGIGVQVDHYLITHFQFCH